MLGGTTKRAMFFQGWGGFCCKYEEQKGAGSLAFGTAGEGKEKINLAVS